MNWHEVWHICTSEKAENEIKDIMKVLRSARVSYSKREPDIAIVVGGDGAFGYYGRTLSIPMLFVGVKDPNILGSKSVLAEIYFDHLRKVLHDIETGKYRIDERRMLSVKYKGNVANVLTDVYLERGISAGCLRYTVSVKRSKFLFTDYAIGNGVIVSTSFGSAGYYSYPDRMKNNKNVNRFADDKIGICHIIPSFLLRGRGERKERASIRYSVPSKSIIKIRLMREADARLYGTTKGSKGVVINVDDEVTVTQSNKTAKIIRLK
jgi:NAD+ kinase